jgi:CheY-like chemotaxis protein
MDKAKILLVDDRQENLLALEAILSSLDQTLVRAQSGADALKALLNDDFALILLDVQMPGMDGFETASHIKRRERTKDVPIIFLTAIDKEPHHAFRGYAAGAVDYLSKPFDPWVLRAKVSVFVELDMKNRQLREQAELLSRVAPAAKDAPPDGELSACLWALEDQVGWLASQEKVVADPAIGQGVAALEERLAHLRTTLESLQLITGHRAR